MYFGRGGLVTSIGYEEETGIRGCSRAVALPLRSKFDGTFDPTCTLDLAFLAAVAQLSAQQSSPIVMFKSPDIRLSASNSAVLASESFLVPVTLHSEARTSEAAFDGLRQAFEEVSGFVSQLVSTAPGIALVSFNESISPKMSRVEVLLHGKEYRYDLTFALKCPVPKVQDFWARIRLLSSVYDRLGELAAGFQERKGIVLYLEEARLDQQKDDSERLQAFRKESC